MDLFFTFHAIIVLIVMSSPVAKPYTVVMPDSGALVDGPQTGSTMNKYGARTDPHEQEAVYDIMKATGNDWATDIPDVCRGRWHGIECMPDKDNLYHIVSLSFGALSDDTTFPTCDPLRSFISPSITKLPHLRTLFFYQCFTNNLQRIPTFLGKLGSSLQTLVLRENGHIGPIPSQLGNLTNLRVLDLHNNNLNGSIPVSIAKLTGLRSLDLSQNQLTGPLPTLNFPMLNILDLNRNHLQGALPSSISSCHSLTKIDLGRNRFSGPIPNSIGLLKNLVLMDLSYNSLSGPLPTSLNQLNSLQALILNGNPMVSTTIPTDFFNGMKDLMILVLSGMNLQGLIPSSLARLPKLRVLHLDGNRLNGSIPVSFGDLNNLSELRLDNNKLSGPVPFKREMVWRMRRKLRLHNNPGLCYDARTGPGDDLSTFSDSGISHCETTPEPSRKSTVQHLSSVDGDDLGSRIKSGGANWKPGFVARLIYSTILLLFMRSFM